MKNIPFNYEKYKDELAELKAAFPKDRFPGFQDTIDELLQEGKCYIIPEWLEESGHSSDGKGNYLFDSSPKEIIEALQSGNTDALLEKAKRMVLLDELAEKWFVISRQIIEDFKSGSKPTIVESKSAFEPSLAPEQNKTSDNIPDYSQSSGNPEARSGIAARILNSFRKTPLEKNSPKSGDVQAR